MKGRAPGDSRSASAGTATFASHQTPDLPTLNLPIGTVNNPSNISSILLDPSPSGEDPNSPMGRIRLYNQADLVIVMSSAGTLSASSGRINNFATPIPAAQLNQFVKATEDFHNGREDKTVKVIDLDVAKLRQWNATNTLLQPLLPLQDVRTVYVVDQRSHSTGNQSGVRVINGAWLPPKGLTVVTPNPLYVKGHYNVTTDGTPANLATHNTSATLPASLIGDAVTILSPSWNDASSTAALNSTAREADATTMNAAILAGNVPTTSGSYSGGLENFPRFLESWTGKTLTYNGSMVCLFRSRVAQAPWRGTESYYDPPDRDWAFDTNFNDLAKLPPSTPMARLLIRGSWAD